MLINKKLMSYGVLCIAVIVLLFGIVFSGKIVESVSAEQIKIIQDPIDGELHYYVTPGMKYQNFGSIVTYPKRGQLWFVPADDVELESKEADMYGLRLRFNDAGSAILFGSISYDLPLDEEHLKLIRTKYSSREALEKELIQRVVNKAAYMTGPTMSSKESYSDKRSLLVELIEDQAKYGAYKTKITEERVVDVLSGSEKTVTVAKIVEDINAPNGRARQEESPLARFGIKVYNLDIKKIKYAPEVLKQIEVQRKANMDVQTAIAEAKKAEQDAIKAEEVGKAEAMTAKWEQEKLNAKEIALAEKGLKVAKLDKQAAEFTKQKDILLGQGQAEKKRLVMAADGALEKKLEAYIKVNAQYADAMAKYEGAWVPQIEMGRDSNGGGNGAMDMINLLSIKAAKDLGLDMEIKKK